MAYTKTTDKQFSEWQIGAMLSNELDSLAALGFLYVQFLLLLVLT